MDYGHFIAVVECETVMDVELSVKTNRQTGRWGIDGKENGS